MGHSWGGALTERGGAELGMDAVRKGRCRFGEGPSYGGALTDIGGAKLGMSSDNLRRDYVGR